jgi:hypothetical protein
MTLPVFNGRDLLPALRWAIGFQMHGRDRTITW